MGERSQSVRFEMGIGDFDVRYDADFGESGEVRFEIEDRNESPADTRAFDADGFRQYVDLCRRVLAVYDGEVSP